MPVVLWGAFQAAMWLYAGFQLGTLFHFGRSHVAAGHGWFVSLIWASVITAILCAIFPSVRKVVVKMLAWCYRKFVAAGEAIKAEASKTEQK